MMSAPCSQTTGFHIASKRSTDRGCLQAAPGFSAEPVSLAEPVLDKRVVKAVVGLVAVAVKRAAKVRVDHAAVDLAAAQAAPEQPKQPSFRPGQPRAPRTSSAIKTAR